MLAKQLFRTALVSLAILVVAIGLDYFLNVILMPGTGHYTPLSTIGIVLLVAPAFTFYLIRQHAKVERALNALAEERVARQSAERANAAKSQFLAMMSHELRTPLNAVLGYSEIMRESAESDQRTTDVRDHGRVISAAQKLLRLINQVLDYADFEANRSSLNVRTVDIAALAREAIDAVRAEATENGNRVALNLGDDLGEARTDAAKLQQCLGHLLANAAKFTRDGAIGLRVRRDGERLVFDVRDTGIGIAPEKQEAVFQPFVQAEPAETRVHGGAGLGLAIAQRLARLLEGDLTVTSLPGKGSTFSLEIPATIFLKGEHLRRVA
ncbi:MAG: ATP-binding protein [Hyphomonadaceae bacterium]|nr:ATP-binding protein [Hyphomonadaceae bacterium]